MRRAQDISRGATSRCDLDGSRSAWNCVYSRGCWKMIGRIGFLRRDFRKLWKKYFPVTLAFAQEPALDGEWMEGDGDGN